MDNYKVKEYLDQLEVAGVCVVRGKKSLSIL